jgi:transposase-like protein
MARRGGRQRDPLREKFWRRAIRQQQRSGLTVRAFCLREGIKDGAFRWWRQALARRDGEVAATTQADRDGEPTEAVPAFLPVRLVDLEAVSSRPTPPIEVVLPTGPIVRVPSGFDPRTLGQVLAVLEGRSC